MVFEKGSTTFIIESNRLIREVTISQRRGDFYVVRFGDRGGIQVRGSRLFATRGEAEAKLPKEAEMNNRPRHRSPYDYPH